MANEGKTGPPDVSGMHTLKVDNLTYQTSIEELRAEFGKFGEVGDIYVPRHFGSGDPKGYAFVRFHDIRDAEDAINGLNGKEIDGRIIRVQMAKNKRPDDPKSFYSRGRRDSHNDNSNRGRDRSRDRSRDRYSDRRRSRSGGRGGGYNDNRRSSRSRSGGRDRDRDRYYDRRDDSGRDSYRRDDRDNRSDYRPRY